MTNPDVTPAAWSWCGSRTRRSRAGLGAGARQLARDHVREQLDDRRVAAHPHVPVLVGLGPVPQLSIPRELIEIGPGDGDLEPGVPGGIPVDPRAGNLHSPDRGVAAAG